MKKLFCLLLAFALLASVCAVPAFATETPTETETPAETEPAVKVTITKHPTGETVDEGGTAMFVAHAENATGIVWRIVSNDTTNTVQAADAPNYFKGVSVSGIGTDVLTLSNIPASMDGWRVEAKFEGPGGPVYSNGALIRVNGAQIKAPTISAQPQPLSLASGETGTLTVSAATANGTLRFQWYSNTANSNVGGTQIDGATTASYTPAELTGTTYYYVAVKSVDNGRESAAVNSEAVAVTYAAPVEPEESAKPGESARPEESAKPGEPAPLIPVIEEPTETEPGSDTPQESETPSRDSSRSASSAKERAGNALNMLTVAGGVLAVAAIAGGITALVLRRRADDEDDDDDYDD